MYFIKRLSLAMDMLRCLHVSVMPYCSVESRRVFGDSFPGTEWQQQQTWCDRKGGRDGGL